MVARYQAEGRELTEAAIRHELEGNICRCTGYHNIVKAIDAGAQAMSGLSKAAE
jgi:carbon-monoxide dehydrogenase small subunit